MSNNCVNTFREEGKRAPPTPQKPDYRGSELIALFHCCTWLAQHIQQRAGCWIYVFNHKSRNHVSTPEHGELTRDHAHLAPGGVHPSKVNNTFGGGCLDPQQFVHILWGGSTDPQQSVHILWGGSTDPQQFVHILGGGWGREGHQLWCQFSHGTGHLAPLELPNFPQSAPRVCTHPLGWGLGPPAVCTHPWGWGGGWGGFPRFIVYLGGVPARPAPASAMLGATGPSAIRKRHEAGVHSDVPLQTAQVALAREPQLLQGVLQP